MTAAARPAGPALVVLPGGDLDTTVDWFVEQLGFRLLMISPADDPKVATLEGHGLRVQLERGLDVAPGLLRVPVDGATADLVGPGVPRGPQVDAPTAARAGALVAPNGTTVELVAGEKPIDVPPLQPSFVLSRAGADDRWITGRAGMRYRDLLPDRLGGRFIASHIAIPDGGPVPDYVHFHRVRFQLIFCHRGWVRVVYEDQGPPFVLEEGDCVLQPPGIRHRVLEASPGLHVVELSCPAEHETRIDHDLPLPTAALRAERDFGGQRFARHVAATAEWRPWRQAGYEARDTGIDAATDGLAGVRVVRPAGPAPLGPPSVHDGELLFWFVLHGAVRLVVDPSSEPGGAPQSHDLEEADAVAVPGGLSHRLADPSADLELLEVTLPASLGSTLRTTAAARQVDAPC